MFLAKFKAVSFTVSQFLINKAPAPITAVIIAIGNPNVVTKPVIAGIKVLVTKLLIKPNAVDKFENATTTFPTTVIIGPNIAIIPTKTAITISSPGTKSMTSAICPANAITGSAISKNIFPISAKGSLTLSIIPVSFAPKVSS